MTNGQIQQLQDLNKCYMPRREKKWLGYMMEFTTPLTKLEKAWLRCLTHKYRHQIKAMEKNRRKVAGNQPEVARNGRKPL